MIGVYIVLYFALVGIFFLTSDAWRDSASNRDGKTSWSERMMRRATTEGSQLPFPATPSGVPFGNGFTGGGSSSFEAFLSTGNIRSESSCLS